MALACNPSLLIDDKPTIALDVTIQAQILDLLARLQRERGMPMLFISHDLAVVEYICDTVIVLYLGRAMKIARAAEAYANPRHPYTRALLSAIPEPVPGRASQRQVLVGDIPSPANPPSGCVIRTRCPYAIAACAETIPALYTVCGDHRVACIR